jgi:hypothetical protein
LPGQATPDQLLDRLVKEEQDVRFVLQTAGSDFEFDHGSKLYR